MQQKWLASIKTHERYSFTTFTVFNKRWSPTATQNLLEYFSYGKSNRMGLWENGIRTIEMIWYLICVGCQKQLRWSYQSCDRTSLSSTELRTDLCTTTRYLQGVSAGLGPSAPPPQLHLGERQRTDQRHFAILEGLKEGKQKHPLTHQHKDWQVKPWTTRNRHGLESVGGNFHKWHHQAWIVPSNCGALR